MISKLTVALEDKNPVSIRLLQISTHLDAILKSAFLFLATGLFPKACVLKLFTIFLFLISEHPEIRSWKNNFRLKMTTVKEGVAYKRVKICTDDVTFTDTGKYLYKCKCKLENEISNM
jgi:hypothetical protein